MDRVHVDSKTLLPFYYSPSVVKFHPWSQQSSSATHQYYALGYPSCPHYKNQGLSEDLNLSPLRITRHHLSADKNPPSNDNGEVKHSAPTARGMSGGPLFYVEKDTIHIFGVISKALGGQEYGCY